MARRPKTDDIDPDEFLRDAEAPAADPKKIARVFDLANKALALQMEIEAAEAALTSLRDRLERLTTIEGPEAMREAKMKEHTFDDGTVLGIKDFLSISIPSERRPAAYDWLRKNKAGDLIKRELSIQFRMGEDRKADALKRQLKKYVPSDTTTVPSSSLTAWARERQAKGLAIPDTLFKVYSGSKMTLTRPKKQK